MTSPSILPADQLAGLNQLVVNKWTDMASIALVVYECLITMDMEVELVWKSRWNFTKILYLLNRYVIIADAIVLELNRFGTNVSSCKPLLRAAGVLYMSGILVSASIFIMRVIVVWKTAMRKYMFIIVLFGAIYIALVIYFLASFLLLLRPLQFFTLLPFGGCLNIAKEASSWEEYTFWKEYTCLLVYDALMLASVAYPTIRTCIIFYIYLFLFDILCLAMQLSFHDNIFLLVVPSCIVRSILASRVILHIRELCARPMDSFVGTSALWESNAVFG
ncbi:hypothetical protein AGABI1DRAFT_104860 [Agaricus bisporus var. burnettii JB137-S8]|uniref:DUF6533 domain-containing protein n=1 Tax=Agaricus bisporus var. burnettii (strain JB137-S8 / ATCC MYA-4627 / FGSC 10392) TaxID=597362 RepID=K5W8F0_AGABU|nr:uncharacterized protein AGABI1DRAFT_104860 [Agaricus bisporus var. burnettii JB137-S8]EKM83109.1 hypothetical protein AGABI1DRAFT_104860 [Agaricus bisporus var. burnettii JB137-S8]